MNYKLLILVMIVAVGVSSYGVLVNQIDLNIQKFELISMPTMSGNPEAGTTVFSSVKCSCSPSPNAPFSPNKCNVSYVVSPNGPDGIPGNADDVPGVPTPNSLGVSGNKLCTLTP